MKVTVELYGATKDLSSKNFLEIDIKNNSTIQDVKFEIIKFIDKKFEGNKNLKQIIESSAFCSENDKIISENYIISKSQTIGIIPPIGGG